VTDAELTIALVGARKGREGDSEGDFEPSSPISGELSLDEDALRLISPVLPTVERRPRVIQLASDMLSGVLASEAASGRYDLVIMGAENRAVQHRLFFGADTERLVRSAPVSIALVVPNIGLLR
jgi:hypothetical protein